MGNCLIISLTTASFGPLTLFSLSLALACKTKSTVNSAFRPSSVNCWFLFFRQVFTFFLDFLCFLHVGAHLVTVPLKFVHTILSAAFFFVFFLPWLQAVPHPVFSSGFRGLSPEHSPLDFVVHLAAASSPSLTFSGVFIISFSFCAFVRCCIFLAAFSMFFLYNSQIFFFVADFFLCKLH